MVACGVWLGNCSNIGGDISKRDDAHASAFITHPSHFPPVGPLPQALYNVETTYNEELYTTRLDRDRCGISEAEAARIAAEIERGDTTNLHLAEERGQHVDDSGVSGKGRKKEDRQGWGGGSGQRSKG